ncbi:MAG: hypothetical protein AB7R67_18765 [Vicinamibacterales bacterium]
MKPLTGLLVLLVTAPLASSPVGLTIDYVLIAQRPDEGGAVRVPYTTDFAACCSAFSASTVSVEHPTPPVRWAHFLVHMTARTAQDAVRLRRYSWVWDGARWQAVSSYSPAFAAPLIGAPRSVGFYLSPAEWAERPTGETFYVLETRGSPVIFGAKLRVLYERP